jgi:hypothetical protein
VLIATSVIVLGAGDKPLRVDHRDREVLEVALRDFLNPKNPVFANGENDRLSPPAPLTMVIHRLAGGDHDADVFKDQKMVSAELLKSWQRRNSGRPIPLKEIGLQGKEFIVIDVDRFEADAEKEQKSFWELFRERYPNSVGCAHVSLPGYSRVGAAAVVEFSVANNEYHPAIYFVVLANVDGRWSVGWRHLEHW